MNTQINIAENGTTTLATAGKYCDRNIDINTNVPTYKAELAEQKTITRSIASRTIVEFVDNEITELGGDAFRSCKKLERVVIPNVHSLKENTFYSCDSLKKVEFGTLINKGVTNNTFRYCSGLEAVIIRGQQCNLQHISAFSDSAVAASTGYIYVPDNLVESYKTATNWVTYASQIKPISELEE